MLELEKIDKNYVSPDGSNELPVLRGISLSVNKGQTIAILGPSGSGKTTLLNIMGTLDRPTTGKVMIQGHDVSHLAEPELARLRNRKIGFVFQLHHLLPQCTLLENVLLPAIPYGLKIERSNALERASLLLERVSLGNLKHHRPGQVSVGQRQRTAVVRALINSPGILLADEPTGSLDAETARELGDLLMELNEEEGTAMVVVTHSAALAQRMHTVLILKNGRLEDGKTERTVS